MFRQDLKYTRVKKVKASDLNNNYTYNTEIECITPPCVHPKRFGILYL